MCEGPWIGQLRLAALRLDRGILITFTERGRTLLAIIAAILFAIAFVIVAASISVTVAIFTPTALLLAGLALLALHMAGIGPAGRWRR
jgi:predicted membrane protein